MERPRAGPPSLVSTSGRSPRVDSRYQTHHGGAGIDECLAAFKARRVPGGIRHVMALLQWSVVLAVIPTGTASSNASHPAAVSDPRRMLYNRRRVLGGA